MKKGQRTEKAEETRKRILDSALKLFRERGYDETTMRDIASEAQMAVGAAYYYFRTKDELVLAFYEQTSDESLAFNKEIIKKYRDFEKRFLALMEFKLQQLLPYRSFIGVIASSGVDPQNPLSPFSQDTSNLRQESIDLIEEVIEGSNIKISQMLRPYLPRLLWFYQMGIVFFWIHDHSPKQERSTKLLNDSFAIVARLIRLSTFPLLRPVNRSIVSLLETLFVNESSK